MYNSNSPQPLGSFYFGFELTTSKGQVVSGGAPQVFLGRDRTTPALGPFPATWHPFEFTGFGDKAPRSAFPGTYSTTVTVPEPGTYTAAVVLTTGGKRAAGASTAETPVPVTTDKIPAAIGSPAIPVDTPVATTTKALEEICTRRPPDPMHAISLADALKNGKPTVVTFATPALCESMFCGPVVDEQLGAFQKIGAEAANFIHVEEFLPGPGGVIHQDGLSPGFTKWGFTSEPWTIFIDARGVIRGRFEGPFTDGQIEAVLQPLL